MGVRIDEINVEKAGPINGLQLALGSFNLIYGRNEQGKTFLVEFLIRSLFNNLSGWSFRPDDSRGKVIVSGLREESLSLMPSSKRKLEHYLEDSGPGLPSQISRLLVVKGAELNFEDNHRSGVSQGTLKEFLSGQGVLDDIQKRISKTIQKAKVVDGRIEGDHRGEIANVRNAASQLDGTETLFQQVEAVYSGAERQALQSQVAELEEKILLQEAAKRHQAYLLQQQLNGLQAEIDRLPEEETGPLAEDIKAYNDTLLRIDRLESQLAELAQKSAHHEWLEQAIAQYEQRGKQGKAGTGQLFPLLILLCLGSAVVTSFFNVPLGTFGLITIAIIVGWFYWRQLQTAVDNALDVDEIKRLEQEFERRFGRPLSGLPLMQKAMKATAEAYHGAKAQRDTLRQEQVSLAGLHDQIVMRLQQFAVEATHPEEWQATIRSLLSKQKELRRQLNERQVALAALGVAERDYQPEPATGAYDPMALQALQEELAQVKERLATKTTELDTLKHRICQETGDGIAIDWATLIQNLQRKREAAVADHRDLKAHVLAGILVNEVLDTIRAQENEKIQEKLASRQVSAPIQRITRRYSGVRYDDGLLSVIDDFGEFPVSDLSTGAREQVLLALRLGFAAHILGHDRLFLLLDDAFQHADWQRRVWLLDQMVDLARDGWQIIYFTMDDHIKRLFDAAGGRVFADQYRFYDLTA